MLFGDHRRTSLDVATCDERADCAAGQECCTLPEHPGETTVTACVPKGDCIYARACRVDSECAAGTECRANINECVRGERASCGHTRCVPTLSPVSCDGKPCTPSAPVCLLGDGGPRCTSAGESRDLPRLLCTKPSQCGDGRRCCLERAPSGDRIESATCMDDCLHEAMNVACETDGDCIFAVEKKCKPLAGRPRGIKMCQ